MSAISQSELWHAANKSTATMQSHRLHKSIHTIFPSALIAAAMLIVAISGITVSAQPPGGDFVPRFDRGAVAGNDWRAFPLVERDPLGDTQRNCAKLGSPALSFPSNDFASMEFGTASIIGPPNATTQLSYMENLFDWHDDALSSPGVFYNRVDANSIATIPHVNQAIFNNPTGISATVTEPGPPSRYESGSVSIANGVVTGSLTDDKSGTPTPGASIAITTFEETYRINAGGGFSFNGGLAFTALIPKAVTGTPGAAAVSLSTKMSMSLGTTITNVATGNIFDGNCEFLGTIGAAVSQGISDGSNATPNTGQDENFFGNAEVGFVAPASPNFPIQGTVNISSSTVGPNELYDVAGTWQSPVMSFGNFAGQPIIVTFSHTLTMIADPGAVVELAPLRSSDLATLPYSDGPFLITTGAVIPEPSSLMLLCLASGMVLVPGRRRA